MRDHPLTPMRDPSLVRVLQRQTTRPGRAGAARDRRARRRRRSAPPSTRPARGKAVRHAIVDAIADTSSRGHRRGGGRPHADHRRLGHRARPAREFPPPGPARRGRRRRRPAARSAARAAVLSGIVLAGDARRRSRICAERAPVFTIDPIAIAEGERRRGARRSTGPAPLLGDGPVADLGHRAAREVAAVQQRLGRERAGALVEETLAAIARGPRRARRAARFVVAGGETAGRGRAGARRHRTAHRPADRSRRAVDREPRRAGAGAGAEIRQFRRRRTSFCAPLDVLTDGAASMNETPASARRSARSARRSSTAV